MKRETAIMEAIGRLIESGDYARLNNPRCVETAFGIIGFPEDAARFVAAWCENAVVYAYNRWLYGPYDWATVGVFDTVGEVEALYGEPREVLEEYGIIVEDASFEGVIVLIEY